MEKVHELSYVFLEKVNELCILEESVWVMHSAHPQIRKKTLVVCQPESAAQVTAREHSR